MSKKINFSTYQRYNHRYDIDYKNNDTYPKKTKVENDLNILNKIKSDKDFITTEECQDYFYLLEYIISNNKYEFYTNVVLSELLNNRDKYLEYFTKYKDILEKDYSNEINIINKIKNKVIENKVLSQKELDTICGIMADKTDKNDLFYKDLIRYIINLTTNKNCKLKISYEMIEFFCTYLKYEYKNMTTEDEFDVDKITIYGTDKDTNDTLAAISRTVSGTNIEVMRKQFVGKDLKISYELEEMGMNILISREENLIIMIEAIFHEITHEQQYLLSLSSDYDEIGLLYLIENTLYRYSIDNWNLNYSSRRNEIDAFEQGKVQTLYLIKKYLKKSMEKKNLINVLEYAIQYEYKRIGYAFKRERGSNKKYEANYYNIITLSKLFKDRNIRKEYLYDGSLLREIFLENGKIDNRIILGNKDICKSNLGKDITLGLIDIYDNNFVVGYIDKYLYSCHDMDEYKKKCYDISKYLLDTLEYRLYKISLLPDRKLESIGEYSFGFNSEENFSLELEEYHDKFLKELDVVENIVSRYGDKTSLIRLNNIIIDGDKLYRRKYRDMRGRRR